MYLLNTNAVIALLKGAPRLLGRMKARSPSDFAISSIVAHELYFGAYKGLRTDENLAQLDALRFEVLEFDREDARCAGEIRAALARAGLPIGPYDVLIAGQALSRSLTLITRNVGEFGRVPALKLEDWES